MIYIFRAVVLRTQVNIQIIAKLVLMLLHVSTVNCSHPQGAISVEDITIQRDVQVVIHKW